MLPEPHHHVTFPCPQAYRLCSRTDDHEAHPDNNAASGRFFGRGPLPAGVLPVGARITSRYEAYVTGICTNHMRGIETVVEDGVELALNLFASERGRGLLRLAGRSAGAKPWCNALCYRCTPREPPMLCGTAGDEHLNSILALEQEGELGPARVYFCGEGAVVEGTVAAAHGALVPLSNQAAAEASTSARRPKLG